MSFFDDENVNLDVLKRKAYNLRWAEVEEGVIPLTAADPDFPCPPMVKQAMLDYISDGYFSYTPKTGFDDFKIALSNYVKDLKNENIPAKNVLPVDSAAPVYYSCVIDEKNRKMDLSKLESCITDKTKMIGLCNPHNPYGLTYTKEELDYIMSLCEKYDLYIMNDEIWSDIVYPDAKFESIYCLGNERCHRVMSVFGYSKSFGLAGLRVGCVYTTNDDAFDKLVEASDVMSTAGGATSISQVAAIAAMNDSRDWGKEFIKHLTENRDYAVNFINNNIPQLHAYRPKATYLLYVDIKDLNCTAVELVDFLKKEVKLSVVPGGHNYFGDQSEGHVRICIATSKGILHEGLNRLKSGVEKFVSQKG